MKRLTLVLLIGAGLALPACSSSACEHGQTYACEQQKTNEEKAQMRSGEAKAAAKGECDPKHPLSCQIVNAVKEETGQH